MFVDKLNIALLVINAKEKPKQVVRIDMLKFPDFSIFYTGTDVSADLRPFLLQLKVEDYLSGQSDQLSIKLDNRDGRWLDDWIPSEGDVVEVRYGYRGQVLSPLVGYEVDRLRWRGSPDTVEIGALATPITKSLRQKRSNAYENTTLKIIANDIASRHDLMVVGDIPEISFKRVTQKRQADLVFLKELADDYGLSFKIDGLSSLVFYRESSLESAEPIMTLDKTDLSAYGLSRDNAGTYQQAKISYQNPNSGEFIEVTVGLDGEEVPNPTDEDEGAIASGDTLNIRERVENLGVARIRAVEALKRANQSRVSLNASLEGNPLLMAGGVITFTGFGKQSGNYLATRAVHTQSPQYTTGLECRKIPV